MQITEKHLADIALCLKELADEAAIQKNMTQQSIAGTNRVITVFTLLGSIIVLTIFYYFIAFNKGVSHSVESMNTIKKQMADLRDSMDIITFSVDEVGQNISYVNLMSTNINSMGKSTSGIVNSIYSISKQTHQLAQDTQWIRYNATIINQYFGHLNYSISNVSQSLHEVAKPIDQFFPLP